MKNIFKNRFFVGSLCVLLAAVITFFVVPAISDSSQKELPVYVVASPVAKGDMISDKSITTVNIPSKYLPTKAVTDKADIIGKYDLSDLAENEYFFADKLSEYQIVENSFFKQLDENNLAVSITLKSIASGVSAKLEPNDIVSLISVSESKTEIPKELEYVKLLSITTETAKNYDAQNKENVEIPSTVTLLATPKQAQLIADLELNSNLHLALVSRGNNDKAAELLNCQNARLSEVIINE
ncbi:MAG: RcpC/CpaB family pilus assembly protein [Oscillospiraceae bacterium]